MKKQNQIENFLSVNIKKPQNLPSIKEGENIFTENAFHVLLANKKKRNRAYILHVNPNPEKSLKFVILMNKSFVENKTEPVYILTQNKDAQTILTDILKLIPDFKTLFGNSYSFGKPPTKINLSEKDIINSQNRILYAMFFEEKNQDHIDFINDLQIQIFDYITLIGDIQKFHYLYPIARIEAVHMKYVTDNKYVADLIYKILTFDQITYIDISTKDKWNDKILNYIQKYMFSLSSQPKIDVVALNYYEKLGFHVHDPYLHNKRLNKMYKEELEKDRYDILYKKREIERLHRKRKLLGKIEDFTDNKKEKKRNIIEASFEISIDLIFFTSHGYKKFRVQEENVDGIRLKKGDELHLTYQYYDFENGHYYVIDIDHQTNMPIISNGLYWDWNNDIMNIIDLDLHQQLYTLKIDDNNNYTNIHENMPVFIGENMILKGNVEKTNPLIVKVHPPEKENENDYTCIGNTNLKTKEACQDPYLHGQLRDITNMSESIWDRRCKTDNECPFFEKKTDKNDKKYRGGCTNGYCEMPLNVEKLGFRKYVDNDVSYPFCKNCEKEIGKDSMHQCCEKRRSKQGNNDIYYFS